MDERICQQFVIIVSRKGLLLLLLTAAGLTGLVAWRLLGGPGATLRRDSDREAQPAPEPGRRNAPSGDEEREAEEKTRPPGATWRVSGVVRDDAGRPVAGAYVRATTGKGAVWTETGTGGVYSLDLPSFACTFDVLALQYLPLLREPFVGERGGPWRHDFRLTPAASLSGRVTDGSGTPVKNARIYVISPERFLLDLTLDKPRFARPTLDKPIRANVVATDADGRYVFFGLREGTTDVGVRMRGYLPQLARDVPIPASGALVRDFVLAGGRRIEVVVAPEGLDAVVVTAADSRLRSRRDLPPGGVEVLVDALVGRAFVDQPVLSVSSPDEKGVYVLEGVGPGPADVEAVHDPVFRMEGARPVAEIWITETGYGRLLDTIELRVHLTLLKARQIAVAVRDATTGQPLRPQVVRRTDGTGPFPFRGVVPSDDRRHELHFALDGYRPAKLDLTRGIDRYDVAMERLAEGKTGTFYLVFDPPLDGRVAVALRRRAGDWPLARHVHEPDGEGRWVVTDVPPGQYVVSVMATGMVPVVLPRVVVTLVTKETYRLRVEKGGGLELKVADSEGKLLDKVVLELRNAAGDRIDVHLMTRVSEKRGIVSVNYLPSAATVRADSGLAAGLYILRAGREGYLPSSKEFVVSGTDVATVTIVLRKP